MHLPNEQNNKKKTAITGLDETTSIRSSFITHIPPYLLDWCLLQIWHSGCLVHPLSSSRPYASGSCAPVSWPSCFPNERSWNKSDCLRKLPVCKIYLKALKRRFTIFLIGSLIEVAFINFDCVKQRVCCLLNSECKFVPGLRVI